MIAEPQSEMYHTSCRVWVEERARDCLPKPFSRKCALLSGLPLSSIFPYENEGLVEKIAFNKVQDT